MINDASNWRNEVSDPLSTASLPLPLMELSSRGRTLLRRLLSVLWLFGNRPFIKEKFSAERESV